MFFGVLGVFGCGDEVKSDDELDKLTSDQDDDFFIDIVPIALRSVQQDCLNLLLNRRKPGFVYFRPTKSVKGNGNGNGHGNGNVNGNVSFSPKQKQAISSPSFSPGSAKQMLNRRMNNMNGTSFKKSSKKLENCNPFCNYERTPVLISIIRMAADGPAGNHNRKPLLFTA